MASLVRKHLSEMRKARANQLARLKAAFADPETVDCCICGKDIPVSDPCCLANYNPMTGQY